MATVFPDSARVFTATALLDQADTIYVAMGFGDEDWDDTPEAPTTGLTALVSEHGRRKAASVQYATPTGSGAPINTDLGTYYVSQTPTNFLYVLGQFTVDDVVGEVVREVGVFGGVVLNNGVDDADFILPAQLSNAGQLMAVSRFTAFTRADTVRQNFEFVIEL